MTETMLENENAPEARDQNSRQNDPPDNQEKRKRRTKTGCLTCRKRRIKCDETRPTCANCLKSKRTCEGYSPPITFRNSYTPIPTRFEPRVPPQFPPVTTATESLESALAGQRNNFVPIAPRVDPRRLSRDRIGPEWPHDVYPDMQMAPPSQPHPYPITPITPSVIERDPVPDPSRVQHNVFPDSVPYDPSDDNMSINPYVTIYDDPTVPTQQPYWLDPSRPYDEIIANDVPANQARQDWSGTSMQSVPETSSGPSSTQYIETGDAEVLDDDDDEYYDVESDDDEMIISLPEPGAVRHDAGLMLALQATRGDTGPRSYNTFLDIPNMLATYVPRFSTSPLMDSTTARIFAHFIVATAPSLSVFERHPINPSIIFSGKPVPKSHQSLWTYTIPMMALSNRGLLQAILALASLQICRLQKTPVTASMKHYHFGLRTVAKAVATPSGRSKISTLVATLLLAHYEGSTAEHSKWTSHLAGARQLLLEVDFKGISRRIKEMKLQHSGSGVTNWYHPYVKPQFRPFPSDLPWVPEPGAIDERIVSQLMGWRVEYDGFGSVEDDQKPPLSEKAMDDFQIYRDLFWWFCKHDVIQSFISGNRLLLPYDRWVHCSPRAPIGKLDAIYGTMDHVLLIAGRVADFSYRDRIRKVKVMKASGGQWVPPQDLFTKPPFGPPGGAPPGAQGPPFQAPPSAPSAPPPAQATNPQGTSAPPPPPPQFYGMMPTSGKPAQAPPSFVSAPRDQIYCEPSPDSESGESDLAAATEAALVEWAEIQKAFDVFEQSLGPQFQPMTPDLVLPMSTPFGEALQYRTYHMATIWGYFYTSKIVHMRAHPHMPPATLMATGIAAAVTKPWTQLIGRMAMGLPTPVEGEELNPTLGSAMTETILSLFFAGVQFIEAEQRACVIARLKLVAERVGIESAALIASGLERYWQKMAEMGRGPAYKNTLVRTEDEGVRKRKLMTGYSAHRIEPRRGSKDDWYGDFGGSGSRCKDGRNDGDTGESERVDEDGENNEVIERSFIYVSRDNTLNWSHGALGLDQDLSKLDLGK